MRELRDAFGGRNRARLEMHLQAEIKMNSEMHLEAVIERVCRCICVRTHMLASSCIVIWLQTWTRVTIGVDVC